MRLETSEVIRVTNTPALDTFPEFSPDGKKLALVRDHDLYRQRVRGDRSGTAKSPDAGPRVLSGPADLRKCLSKSARVHQRPSISPDF